MDTEIGCFSGDQRWFRADDCDRTRQKEEAARKKERQRRQHAVDKAQTALDEAEGVHAEKSASFDAERAALEKRSQGEDARWVEAETQAGGRDPRARETCASRVASPRARPKILAAP
jgi:hypothetical protein